MERKSWGETHGKKKEIELENKAVDVVQPVTVMLHSMRFVLPKPHTYIHTHTIVIYTVYKYSEAVLKKKGKKRKQP